MVSLFYDDATAVGHRLQCVADSRGAMWSLTATRRRLPPAMNARRWSFSLRHKNPPLPPDASLLPAAHQFLFSPSPHFSPSHYLHRRRCRAKVSAAAAASSGRQTSPRRRRGFSRRTRSSSRRRGTCRTGGTCRRRQQLRMASPWGPRALLGLGF
jgi:hypothetical protein